MNSIEPLELRERDAASRPSLRLVPTPPAGTESSWVSSDEDPIGLKLGFRQLVLIHRSLEAMRTLGLIQPQDDLVTDTLQLIDVALDEAV
jgi:hypothetical protein